MKTAVGFKSSGGAFPLRDARPTKAAIETSDPVALSTTSLPSQNGVSTPIVGPEVWSLGYDL